MNRYVLALGIGTAITFAGLLPNTQVYADEFSLSVVLDPSYTEADKQAFIDGFQLAVDESPDISHPAGVESGDHLGGIDVEISLSDSFNAAQDLQSYVIEASRTADIVVVDLLPENIELLNQTVPQSDSFWLSVQNYQNIGLTDTPNFYAVTQEHDTESFLSDQNPTFTAAYLAIYGTPINSVAQRGYLAGKMVDVAVGATSNDPTDILAMTTRLDNLLITTDTVVPDTIPLEQNAELTDKDTVESESDIFYMWYLIFAFGAGGLLFIWLRKSRN